MGVVLMILGAIYHLATTLTPQPESAKWSRLVAAHLLIGGYGFILPFYLAGADSVPRRFAVYPAEIARGELFANVALLFGLVLLGGIVLYLWETGRRCARALRA
jgi:heme/copper-type cytochrome/quinol oxidase subunit 1